MYPLGVSTMFKLGHGPSPRCASAQMGRGFSAPRKAEKFILWRGEEVCDRFYFFFVILRTVDSFVFSDSFLRRFLAAHLHEWNLPTVVVPKDDTRPVMKIEADVLYVAAKSGNRLKAYEVTTGSTSSYLWSPLTTLGQLKKWAQCSAPPIRHIAKAPSDEHDKFGRLACSFEQRHLSFFVNEHTSSLAACKHIDDFLTS